MNVLSYAHPQLFNRLTSMVAYLRPLIFELRTSLISFRIFVRCQRLIARNVADGFLLILLLTRFNEACRINDVSRGSLSGYENQQLC
jgi:hypothetical protein